MHSDVVLVINLNTPPIYENNVIITVINSKNTSSAKWYKSICPTIPRTSWILNLSLDRRCIIAFTRLGLAHNRLPTHAYFLNLNSSPYHTRNASLNMCNFHNIIFNCPAPSQVRSRLFFVRIEG